VGSRRHIEITKITNIGPRKMHGVDGTQLRLLVSMRYALDFFVISWLFFPSKLFSHNRCL
jgi:hypothetical protein